MRTLRCQLWERETSLLIHRQCMPSKQSLHPRRSQICLPTMPASGVVYVACGWCFHLLQGFLATAVLATLAVADVSSTVPPIGKEIPVWGFLTCKIGNKATRYE